MQSKFPTQSPQPSQGQKKSNTSGDPVHPQVSLFFSQIHCSNPKMTVKDWSTLSTDPFSSFLSERFPRTCLLLYQQTSVLSTSRNKLKCIREILKNVSAPQTGLRYLCFLFTSSGRPDVKRHPSTGMCTRENPKDLSSSQIGYKMLGFSLSYHLQPAKHSESDAHLSTISEYNHNSEQQ